MARVLRIQLIEALIGLALTALLSHLGDVAALLGLTGTSLVMAVTAQAAESGKVLLAVLSLMFPFFSVTAVEAAAGRPLADLIGTGNGNNKTTIQNVYDSYNGDRESKDDPVKAPIDKNARAEISPRSLTLDCFGKDCRGEVTVKSTGTARLRITQIRFAGTARKAWHFSDDCDNAAIAPGDSCSFRVWADRSDTFADHAAQLFVHDNTPNPPSTVAANVRTGTVSPPPQPEIEQGNLFGVATTGTEPATCGALNGSVTFQANAGQVSWTAVLGNAINAQNDVPDVVVAPASGTLEVGQRQTVTITGAYSGTDFWLNIKHATGAVNFQVFC